MCHSLILCGVPTFEPHADGEALLEAAVWTTFPLRLVHLTFLVVDTHVHLLVLHRPLEKPFQPTPQRRTTRVTYYVPFSNKGSVKK